MPAEEFTRLRTLSERFRESGLRFGVGLTRYEIHLNYDADAKCRRSASHLIGRYAAHRKRHYQRVDSQSAMKVSGDFQPRQPRDLQPMAYGFVSPIQKV
jgi:hypothetical protein